jgi:enamine deaminase RidA (YjgF/YER057c/UK114 family)
MATDLVTGIHPEARLNPRSPYLQNAVELQSWVVMARLAEVMKAAGCDISSDSVRIQQWRVSPHPTLEELEQGDTWTGLSVNPYYRARNHYLRDPRPASTGMGIRQLLLHGGLIGVDLIAVSPSEGASKKGFGVPENLPSPLAGYSPAIRHGDWVFLAGEIPTDWSGDWMADRSMGPQSALAPEARVNPFFWYGSPIEAQTDYTLKKLDAIARAAGTALDRTVKANVYISHPNDYEGMNRIWSDWFPSDPPARVVIPYMGLGGKGCRIEIDLILLANESSLVRRAVKSDTAFEPLGHEPQAMQAGHFLFYSTQIAAGPGGLEPALLDDVELPYFKNTAQTQIKAIFDSMESLAEAAGTSIDNLCQVREFFQDLRSFAPVRQEWKERFSTAPPASTSVEVGASLLVPGCELLLDATAYIPQVL